MATFEETGQEGTLHPRHHPPTPVKRTNKRSRVTDEADEVILTMEEENRTGQSKEKRPFERPQKETNTKTPARVRVPSILRDPDAEDMFFDVTNDTSFPSPILPSPSQGSSHHYRERTSKNGVGPRPTSRILEDVPRERSFVDLTNDFSSSEEIEESNQGHPPPAPTRLLRQVSGMEEVFSPVASSRHRTISLSRESSPESLENHHMMASSKHQHGWEAAKRQLENEHSIMRDQYLGEINQLNKRLSQEVKAREAAQRLMEEFEETMEKMLVDVRAGEENLRIKEQEAKEERKRIHQYVGKVERAFKELRERYDLRKAENAKLLWERDEAVDALNSYQKSSGGSLAPLAPSRTKFGGEISRAASNGPPKHRWNENLGEGEDSGTKSQYTWASRKRHRVSDQEEEEDVKGESNPFA
ncbi:hypothetical protein BJ684DRAFT_15049 [Piptocephalis cylindrospora]|uniref:Uncharacterized protein n=1 Tax=Piptocephalis cylindrospora TaxID=1907219 RepID=A0A4P9Y747_9FUNG|nr:hypothetical protein BJ684DRAFT_15049 [Piptocephalis cylindrospora]|eukprot:RKP14642.1 hypothetical protein BJ684DRAFT_15049 [Piptocephalis cylindrospora]